MALSPEMGINPPPFELGNGARKSPRILVADAPLYLNTSITTELVDRGLRVDTASTWGDAVLLNRLVGPEVIVADPKNLGVATEEVAGLGKRLIITENLRGRNESLAAISALNRGADFFLPKPVSPELLAANIGALLRRNERYGDVKEDVIHAGYEVEFNPNTRVATANGQQVVLTATEFSLLSEMATNVGRVLTFDELLRSVGRWEHGGDITYLRLWTSKLRRKLNDASAGSGSVIKTVQGVGYIFQNPEQAAKVEES